MIASLFLAAALRIRLVYVPTTKSLTQAEFQVFSNDLYTYLHRQVSPRLRISRWIGTNVPEPSSLQSDSSLFKILDRNNDKRFTLTHWVFGPTYENGGWWIYGWGRICPPYPYTTSYSTAEVMTAYGYSLYYESLTAAAHEISHQLGAQHRPNGLMSPNALVLAHNGIPLPTRATRRDWAWCGKI